MKRMTKIEFLYELNLRPIHAVPVVLYYDSIFALPFTDVGLMLNECTGCLTMNDTKVFAHFSSWERLFISNMWQNSTKAETFLGIKSKGLSR